MLSFICEGALQLLPPNLLIVTRPGCWHFHDPSQPACMVVPSDVSGCKYSAYLVVGWHHNIIVSLLLQGEELEPARKKAEAAGVKDIFIDDLREEFVQDYVFPMFR
jgi:hypothetical protein